jgi:hypothetical protein
MTQQTAHDPAALSPSLQAKLQEFAAGLTPEEVEHLRTLQPDDVTSLLSPSLQEKAQRAAEDLSPEEVSQLGQLLQHATMDVQGYMKREYIDLDMPLDPLGGTGGPGLNAGTVLIGGLIVAGALTGAAYGNP